MTRATPNPAPDFACNLFNSALFVEERHLFSPIEPHHYPEPILLGQIEDPTWGPGVNTHNIETMLGNERKVSLDDLTVQSLFAVLVNKEGPVADSFHPELLLPQVEELAPYGWSR